MADQNHSGNSGGDNDRPRPRFSQFSPFPYGSPLTKVNSIQTSFSGSPGQKMLLAASLNQTKPIEREVMSPRLKSQDLYGGPVMFGSSARKSRLISASPYSAAFRSRIAERQARLDRSNMQVSLGSAPPSSLPSTAPSSPHSSPGPSSSPPAPLSSTARVILSTLEKLSSGGTPISDAKKIPLASPSSANRAEKRKLLESELNCSLSSSPSRRRARLGGGGLALALSGPPLRKNFSPSLNNSSSTVSNSSISSSPARPPSSNKLTLAVDKPVLAGLASDSSKTSTNSFNSNDEVNNASSFPIKSSFKMKTKVTEPVRGSTGGNIGDQGSDPFTDQVKMSAGAQLKVDKLPVFNFAPASVPEPPKVNQDNEKSNITCQAVKPQLSPIPPEVLERNNNNKSPVKRQLNDNSAPSESPKKFKCVEKCSQSSGSLPVIKSNQKSLPDEKVSRKFIFSAPNSVIESSEGGAGSVSSVTPSDNIKYRFSVPSSVSRQSNGDSSSSSMPASNFQFSAPVTVNKTTISSFVNKTMPDITNNSLINDKLKGSSSTAGLPDVTATGFGGFLPAKELKTGSVMDILGMKK